MMLQVLPLVFSLASISHAGLIVTKPSEPSDSPFLSYKRDDINTNLPITSTDITYSDKQIYWGCDTDAFVTMNNLSTVCHTTGSCETREPAYGGKIDYITPDDLNVTPDILTIQVSGSQYPPWLRNGVITTMQAAVKAAAKTSPLHWIEHPDPGDSKGHPAPVHRTCSITQAPQEINVQYRNGEVLIGFINVVITVTPDPSAGFCADSEGHLLGIASAVTSLIQPEIGGVLGIISALCS